MPARSLSLWPIWLSVLVLVHVRATTVDQETTLTDSQSMTLATDLPPTLDTTNDTVSVVSTEMPITTTTTICPGCAEKKRKQEETLSAAEIKRYRIKMIKKQILDKLNMKVKPRIHASKSDLPDILFKSEVLGTLSDNRKKATVPLEDYDTTKKLVLFPTNSETNYSCSDGQRNISRCFHFQVTPRKLPGGVTSAQLFLYKKGNFPTNQSFVITEVVSTGQNGTKKERILIVEDEPLKVGWLKFDMTATLQRWISKPHLQYTLQVTCKGCHGLGIPVSNEEKHKPFMVVSTGPVVTVSRKRRETVCTETSTRCCKETLSLTFDEIGWGDWIIHPLNFTANYCRGTCMSELGISRYYHTTVMQRYIHSQRARNNEPSFTLCCTPSRMSSMSIIYMDSDKELHQSVFTNMVVEACDCA